MSEAAGKSAGISPRRALHEEVLEERSKAVAGLPINDQDPGSDSLLWTIGAYRLAKPRGPSTRRRAVLQLCVMALAWLEAIDAECIS